MLSSLASKDAPKPNGEQRFIETVGPNVVDIRDDLIVADGEADVSESSIWWCGGRRAGASPCQAWAHASRAGADARRAWLLALRLTASSGTSRPSLAFQDSSVSQQVAAGRCRGDVYLS